MVIVHVNFSLEFGGIETMLINIANEQERLGNEVHIVLLNREIETSLFKSLSKTIKIHIVGRNDRSHFLKFNPFYFYKMNKCIELIKPDIIHLHHSEFYRLLNKKNKSRKCCCTLHNMPHGNFSIGIIGKVFPILELVRNRDNIRGINIIPTVFSISNAVKVALKNQYNVESMTITNGIRTNAFVKKENSYKVGRLRIILIGRFFISQKGQDLMLNALSMLHGNETVDFIGDGEDFEYLKNLCLSLNLESRVNFLGAKDQYYIANHLKDYDLFVQPSRFEGFGNTVAEAMSAEIPVLVSSIQGPAEITCGNQFGWLFENGKYEDLAKKIEYIENHYEYAQEKAQVGCLHVKKLYDVSLTARKYIENYTRKTSL